MLESSESQDIDSEYKPNLKVYSKPLNLKEVTSRDILEKVDFSPYVWCPVYSRQFILDNKLFFLEYCFSEEAVA